MAKPVGKLVRFPILDSLGNSVEHTVSQRMVTEGLNGKMGINDAYTKAETDRQINNLVVQSLGTDTTKVISQKVVTDELKNRYTKKEVDDNFYNRDQTIQMIKEYGTEAKLMKQAGSLDKALNGNYIGPWADVSGAKPPFGGEGFLSSVITANIDNTIHVFQMAESFPVSGDDLSGESSTRAMRIRVSDGAIIYNSGWSRARSRWSRN